MPPSPSTDQPGVFHLDAAIASRFAALALANIDREYPNQPGHVWLSAADALAPAVLHPAFHGSYDWHSAVHMHWLLARIRRLHPGLPACALIDAAFDRHFAPAAIAGECAYLDRPGTATFERTYGWAWLLKLADELGRSDDAAGRRWAHALAPLAQRMVDRYFNFLPRADYPIRHGLHANSAFGLLFALEFGRRRADVEFVSLLQAKALAWFGTDRDVPVGWEPSGADFLSPALIEALLMRQVLDTDAFGRWFANFLPGFVTPHAAAVLEPVAVRDRGDPQIVHLDGLNLSRAWCLRGLAPPAGQDAQGGADVRALAERHLVAGLQGLASADYGSAHWLASFAVLAMTEWDRAG